MTGFCLNHRHFTPSHPEILDGGFVAKLSVFSDAGDAGQRPPPTEEDEDTMDASGLNRSQGILL